MAKRKANRKAERRPGKSAARVSSLSKWTFLNEQWNVDERGFATPAKQKSVNQTLLFSESLKDATITAEITLEKNIGQRWDRQPASEANVILRYVAQDQHYYAGVGAWGTKFHISKVIPGPSWLRLSSVGSADALDLGRTYQFRVECQGSKIVLFENDTKVLDAYDDDYGSGRWGFHTFKTQARFETRPPDRSPLQCFVAMPFAAEFDAVYELIESVVESYDNIECTRADQLSGSRPIMEDVRNKIAQADLVIVDLTGRNSNVYYEAGMAAAWKKSWILMAQSPEDLTFDVQQIRSILYTNRIGGGEGLEARLRKAIEDTLSLSLKKTGS